MASFSYRAIDLEGEMQSGNIDAANAIDLELRLKRMGMDLIKFESIKKSTLIGARRIARKEIITFCFHMDQLLRAGVPIIDALTDLRDTVENPAFRQIVASILEDIEGGKRLSEAMAEHSQAFDTVFIALIRTGEQTGQLPVMLDRAARQLSGEVQRRATAMVTILEPLLIVGMGGVVMLIVLAVLLPIIQLNTWVR